MEAAKNSVIERLSEEGIPLGVDGDFIWYHKLSVEFWTRDDQFGAGIQPNRCCWMNFRCQKDENSDRFVTEVVEEVLKYKRRDDKERAEYGFIPKEQAQRAAKWWADQLRGKSPKNIFKIPDAPLTGLAVLLMLEDGLQKKDISPRLDRFEQLIIEGLQQEIATPWGAVLQVDYDPQGLLLWCWQKSRLEDDDSGFGRFPWKTTMRVQKEQILVNDQPI